MRQRLYESVEYKGVHNCYAIGGIMMNESRPERSECFLFGGGGGGGYAMLASEAQLSAKEI